MIYIYIWLNKKKGSSNLSILCYVITMRNIICNMAMIFWPPTQYIIANILMSCLFYYSMYSSGMVEHQCILFFFLSSLFLFLLSLFPCLLFVLTQPKLCEKKKSLTPLLYMLLCPEFQGCLVHILKNMCFIVWKRIKIRVGEKNMEIRVIF